MEVIVEQVQKKEDDSQSNPVTYPSEPKAEGGDAETRTDGKAPISMVSLQFSDS